MIKGCHRINRSNVNTSNYWDDRFERGDTNSGTSALESIIEYLDSTIEDKNKKMNIVDIGCGPCKKGSFLINIKNIFKNSTCYAVDISQRICDSWKESDIQSFCLSLPKTNFEKHYFDIILCSHTLEHIDDIATSINEIKRIAKENSIIIVNSPIGESWSGEKEHVWWMDSGLDYGFGDIINSFKGNQYESLVQVYKRGREEYER